jgi:hypothetical protein
MTHAATLLFAVVAGFQAAPDLAQLEESQRFFELRDAVAYRKGDDLDTLYYRGLTRARFQDTPGAIADLQAFLRRTDPKTDAARGARACLMLAGVFGRHSQYREAVRAIDDALKRFPSGLGAEEVSEAKNSRALWNAVTDVPPQEIRVARETTLPTTRTIGIRVKGKIAGIERDFIVDTGANLSCLSTTMAIQIGAKFQEGEIQVGSISGLTVPARLAEMPEIALGDVTIRHAIALVFADKDLTLPGTPFRLDAILGFPVIAGMREISFARDGSLRIPARPGPKRGTDMCLDGLTPLVQATAFGKAGTYSFDTGAGRTALWLPFFREHESEVRAKGTEAPESVTGVGGTRKIPAWRMPSVTLTLAGREVRLISSPILTEPTVDHSRYLHGNLGYDVIRQFNRVTLNFDRMTLALE